MPQTIGPARTRPIIIKTQWPVTEAPEETIPHKNAHIGGNQVMGLSKSNMAIGSGKRRGSMGIYSVIV
jgi:hypothetical protein